MGPLEEYIYKMREKINSDELKGSFTQEEKELLLKDLSARLPNGIVVHYNGLARPLFGIEPTQHFQITLDNALDGEHKGLVYVSLDVDGEEPKPYLRPMSSMTEEEEKEFYNQVYKAKPYSDGKSYNVYEVTGLNIDWLNAHHFDYRGLIRKGLAIEVTKENNPYKQ